MKQALIKLKQKLFIKSLYHDDFSSINEDEIKAKHEKQIAEIYENIANEINKILEDAKTY